MKTDQFRQILREEIQECLVEILPIVVKQVLKEQLTPVLKAMINERKKVNTSSYIGEMKKVVQPRQQSAKSKWTAPVNSEDPIKNMLAETFNTMIPDDYDDYEVPQLSPEEMAAQPVQNQTSRIPQPQLQMESTGQQMPSMVSKAKSVLDVLAPQVVSPIRPAEYYPEADLESINIGNVPDFTALMAKRTFK